MIFVADKSEIRPVLKTRNSITRSALIFIFTLLLLPGCEKEQFYGGYSGMYGSWTIRNVSGGFSGAGYEPDFDILQITNRMHYSLYFHDTLLSEGKIEILDQTSDILRIEFRSKNNSLDPLTGWEKEVYLGQDTLVMNDGCCDMYSYFFIRSNTCNE